MVTDCDEWCRQGATRYNIHPMNLQHYLSHRRRYEASMWFSWFVCSATVNSTIATLDLRRMQQGFQWWEPITWEVSSGIIFLLLLPLVVLLERRFPLARPNVLKHLLIHIAATPVYSAIHVVGMVGIRKIVYILNHSSYDFGHWLSEMAYEYLKDWQTYVGILAVIYLYRFILRRLQGEASLPDDTEIDGSPADRFLVKKLGKEFLVKITDIEWLEASGNYVNLHADGKVYPMRDTMTSMAKRLESKGFIRVHRRIIVNLDRVAEIEPLDTGDARARLYSGALLPISRRYKEVFKAQYRT